MNDYSNCKISITKLCTNKPVNVMIQWVKATGIALGNLSLDSDKLLNWLTLQKFIYQNV